MSSAIEINGLSKRYAKSKTLALDNVSLSVKQGEVYGFLGPNGAGKSTTIRILLNFIWPTGGSASVMGHDVVSDTTITHKHIGYLSGDVSLFDKVNSEQLFSFLNKLQGAADEKFLKSLTDRFLLDTKKTISELSKGNKQKVGLIQALMHQPEVLILDEPTAGLDPIMQEEFFSVVGELKKNGTSVFVSSHNLSEVRRMCDRVGFIREGKLVGEREISELASEAARTYYITFKNTAKVTDLSKIAGVREVKKISDKEAKIHVHGELKPLLKYLAGAEVEDITSQELDLEQEFLQFYETESKK